MGDDARDGEQSETKAKVQVGGGEAMVFALFLVLTLFFLAVSLRQAYRECWAGAWYCLALSLVFGAVTYRILMVFADRAE